VTGANLARLPMRLVADVGVVWKTSTGKLYPFRGVSPATLRRLSTTQLAACEHSFQNLKKAASASAASRAEGMKARTRRAKNLSGMRKSTGANQGASASADKMPNARTEANGSRRTAAIQPRRTGKRAPTAKAAEAQSG
jgi:hypothetical protein